MATPSSHHSVSSWSQPTPSAASTKRTELISEVAERINALGPERLRIAVDGRTAAGKTSFGHELAAALNALGRPTLRACFDDFKNPWSEAHLYDRLSGEGYYRNAYDFPAAVNLLLRPAGPGGDGRVTLCSRDPLTGASHQGETVQAADNAILIVDSVFAFRLEYNDYWDYRIYLDVDRELSIARGIARDVELEGVQEAENLHRNRYGVAERLYSTEVNPKALADVVIDNTDFADPQAVFRNKAELDALLADGGGAWWNGFFSDLSKPCPFFVEWPDENLVEWFDEGLLTPGRVLELGCGNGRNAAFLAGVGFSVDAVDFSAEAIEWAVERAKTAGVPVNFQCCSIFDATFTEGSYDLVYDSGCFHHLAPHRRKDYVELVRRALKPGGSFGLVCFRPEGGSGYTDGQVYEHRSLGGGLGYAGDRLRALWDEGPFSVQVLRRMTKTDGQGPCFGEDFLWALLGTKEGLA